MQAKSFYEKLEVTGEQGDATDKQFVFPRQFLVLGDSQVGKTSLVKSLTGNPFDLEQPKTQGIDQSLVDKEWKSCNLKELVFGDLWRFLKTGDVEVSFERNRERKQSCFCSTVRNNHWPCAVDYILLRINDCSPVCNRNTIHA